MLTEMLSGTVYMQKYAIITTADIAVRGPVLRFSQTSADLSESTSSSIRQHKVKQHVPFLLPNMPLRVEKNHFLY